MRRLMFNINECNIEDPDFLQVGIFFELRSNSEDFIERAKDDWRNVFLRWSGMYDFLDTHIKKAPMDVHRGFMVFSKT